MLQFWRYYPKAYLYCIWSADIILMEECHTVNIKEHFTIELTCPICLNQYDFGEHIPMIICCNQHYVCLVCIEKSFEYVEEDVDQIPCHFCKEPVYADCVDRFRLMEEFVHTSKAVDRYANHVQTLLDKLTIQNRELWQALKEQRQIADQKSKILEILSAQNEGKMHNDHERLSSRRILTSSAHSCSKTKKKQPRYPEAAYYYKQAVNLKSQKSQVRTGSKSIHNSKIKVNSFVVISRDAPQNQRVKYNHDLTVYNQDQIDPLSSKNCRDIARTQTNKKHLPYVVSNPRIISAQDLKRIMRNKFEPQNRGQKIAYINILCKYDFSRLRELDLSRVGLHQKNFESNSLQGCFPSLQSLSLSKNRFSGIPPLICEFTCLKKLIMSHNVIERVSHQLIQLSDLQYLDFWDNKLTVVPEVVYMMKKLQKVDLSNNRITSVLAWICEVKVSIDLFGNPLDITRTANIQHKNTKKALKKLRPKINRTII